MKIQNLREMLNTVFPYLLRRKAKHACLSMLPFLVKSTDSLVFKEWKESRTKKQDILIFGITSFKYRMQRPQHLALQMAKRGHRVFYIENECIPVHADAGRGVFFAEKHAAGVYIVRLGCSRNLFIYRETPSFKEVGELSASLSELIDTAQIRNPIAKIDHPFWSCLLEHLEMPILYDCMDEHSGFEQNSQDILQKELLLAKKATSVLVSSAYLEKKMREAGATNIISMPNAGEYEHFHQSSSSLRSTPLDIAHIHHPIIGYYGAIDEWLDINLMQQAFRAFPTYHFVFLGRVVNQRFAKIAQDFPNVHLLGEKAYADLPAYLHTFDVCIIPFLLTDLTKATHPVKFFEYAASGKPIVTTALPELAQYASACYYARSEGEFLSFLKKAIQEPNARKPEQLRIAQKNTWETRGEALEASLTDSTHYAVRKN